MYDKFAEAVIRLFQILSPNASSRRSFDLLNRITGDGLGITYKFTRTVSIFSMKMVSLDLTFTNTTEGPMKKICMGEKVRKLSSACGINISMHIYLGVVG